MTAPPDILPAVPPDRRVAAGLITAILALGALAAVLLVVPAPLFDLDRFAVPKEAALLTAAFLGGLVVLARAERIELGLPEVLLGCYLAASGLSAVLADNHWLAARALGISLAGATLFLAARFAGSRIDRRVLGAVLLTAVLAGAVSGLAQAYGWSWELLADTRAPGGASGNRNFMAHLTVIGAPLAVWLALGARSRAGYLLGAAVLGVMALAVVLSRSRAAWVGLCCVVVVTAVLAMVARRALPDPGRRRLLGVVAAIGVGVIVALAAPNQLEWRSGSPYRDSLRDVLNYREGSGRGRLIQYRNSLELLRADPILGTGPGNWLVAYPRVTTPGDPSFAAADPIPTNPWPSSDWVALLAERGPVAALCWLGFLVSLGIVALRRLGDPGTAPAALTAIGILTATAVQGLFDAVTLLAPPTFILMAGLGALIPQTRPLRTIELTGRRGRRLLVFGIVLGALLARNAAELGAIVTARDGRRLADLEAAVRLDPGNYRLRLRLAQRAPCPRARVHAEWAADLLPNHPWPARLVRRCR